MPDPKPGALPPATALRLADLVAYAEGSIVSRAIVQEPVASLTLFAFDAGQALSEHTTAFDAYLHVLDGEADLVVGGKAVLVHAGEVALLPAGAPHEVTARAQFKMLLTMVRPEAHPLDRAGPAGEAGASPPAEHLLSSVRREGESDGEPDDPRCRCRQLSYLEGQ